MAPKRKQPNAAADGEVLLRRSARQHTGTRAPPAADPEPPKKKKTKTNSTAAAAAEQNGGASPAVKEKKTAEFSKTVIIEHCKQCRHFKIRADKVKEGLEKDVAGVNVVVNPEKPRRGCFEIREEGGEIFVSLLDMKRPFEPMKKLDMDKLVSDIVEKIR